MYSTIFSPLPPGKERDAFLHTLKALSYGKEEEVKQIILQIHEYKQTLPDGQAWLEKHALIMPMTT